MKTKIQHGDDDGRSGTPTFTIETLQDYELAKRRIAALSDCTKDDNAERELTALMKAVRVWDKEHDFLTRWDE